MFPNLQVNMGYQDPLLTRQNIDYQQMLDAELERLELAKKQLLDAKANTQTPVKGQGNTNASLWDEIDKEINSLTDDQKVILSQDETYKVIDSQLQMLIQNELILSVRDKIANTEQGKALLEKQLDNIKTKKSQIVEESNREIELFKKFQIAAQANPNLTYVEFIKAITANEK